METCFMILLKAAQFWNKRTSKHWIRSSTCFLCFSTGHWMLKLLGKKNHVIVGFGIHLSFTASGPLTQLVLLFPAAAAAAKSLQSCLTLCDPIDGSPPGSPVPGILQTRTLEWVASSFSKAWKWKVKVKSLSRARLLVTPWTAAHQAPPSMGFPGKSTGVGCHHLLLLFPRGAILWNIIFPGTQPGNVTFSASHAVSWWHVTEIYQWNVSKSDDANLQAWSIKISHVWSSYVLSSFLDVM